MQTQEFKQAQAITIDIPHPFTYIELCPVFYSQHHLLSEGVSFYKVCCAKLVGIEFLSDSTI